jgi:hypothetical protein
VIRAACVLALIALAIVVVVAVHLDGFTATLFSFVGIPALVAGMGLYWFARWRAGALRPGTPLPPRH